MPPRRLVQSYRYKPGTTRVLRSFGLMSRGRARTTLRRFARAAIRRRRTINAARMSMNRSLGTDLSRRIARYL